MGSIEGCWIEKQTHERFPGKPGSGFGDAEELGHLVVEEAVAGAVGLDPFAVDDELRDGALAYVGEDEVGGAGGGARCRSLGRGCYAW